jgi:hypothetical protein
MLINHCGCSGGKDSTALLLWMVHESGYHLESIRPTFCDTGNADETGELVCVETELSGKRSAKTKAPKKCPHCGGTL